MVINTPDVDPALAPLDLGEPARHLGQPAHYSPPSNAAVIRSRWS
jgi:hypothetical protein